jgi:hypothetical protein
MVGKLDTQRLDKVETPPSYRVEGTLETRDEGRRQNQSEEDEFSFTPGSQRWYKFHTDAKNRRPLKIRKADILSVSFNHAFLQRGLVIIDVDIVLVNKQKLRHAYIFSTKMDVYWYLRKLAPGSKLNLDEISEENYVEASVLHEGNVVKAEASKEANDEKDTNAITSAKEKDSKKSIINKISAIFKRGK